MIHILENINFLFKHFLFLEIHLYPNFVFILVLSEKFPMYSQPASCSLDRDVVVVVCVLFSSLTGSSAQEKTNADLYSTQSCLISPCFLHGLVSYIVQVGNITTWRFYDDKLVLEIEYSHAQI